MMQRHTVEMEIVSNVPALWDCERASSSHSVHLTCTQGREETKTWQPSCGA